MVLQNKKNKELTTFALITALTNQRILLTKGICTDEEWAQANESVSKTLIDVYEKRESVDRMVGRLNKQLQTDIKEG